MKKFTAMLLTLVLALGCLAGCGGGNGNSNVADEDISKCPEDTYEINWYIMADAQSDVHSVEAKINEYLKDKINVTVKMNCLPSSQYSQKLGTMINANEYFDLCFVARWMLDYVNNSRAGAFFALDDYANSYMKESIASFDLDTLDCARVDGKLYALPVNKEMATQYGWIYRKDIADKYGIDMTQYKNFESLMPVLEKIKASEPDIKYPIDWAKDTAPAAISGSFENFICKDGSYPDTKVMNPYATPEFEKACKTANEFYNKGLVRPDVLTATDQLQRMKEGKTFVMLQPVKPGKAKELFKDSAYEFEQAEITEPYIDYLAGTGSMTAVSASSKNPVRVMRFLNMLNSDAYLKNLVVHGIEGKHYTKIDDKTVEPIANSGYDLYSDSWTIGNVFLDYLTPSEDPEKLEKLKEFNKEAKQAKVNKFILPENDERDRVMSEVNAVIKKHKPQCVMGAVDTESALKDFNAELETVGMPQLIEEIQKEYDEYLKTVK